MGSILGLHRVSGWETEEDEARRPISMNLTRRLFSTLSEGLRERLYCSLKGIWLKTCSVLISLYSCLKGVFLRIKPRKTAGPLTPLQENAPDQKNESYAEHQGQGICISTKKKSQESSDEKERETKKVIESTVVVERARWIKHYSSSHRILLVGEGDFSFSHSLAAAFGCASKMIATSLDSKVTSRSS